MKVIIADIWAQPLLERRLSNSPAVSLIIGSGLNVCSCSGVTGYTKVRNGQGYNLDFKEK